MMSNMLRMMCRRRMLSALNQQRARPRLETPLRRKAFDVFLTLVFHPSET